MKKFASYTPQATSGIYETVFYGPGWKEGYPKAGKYSLWLDEVSGEYGPVMRGAIVILHTDSVVSPTRKAPEPFQYTDTPKLFRGLFPSFTIYAENHVGELKIDGKVWVPSYRVQIMNEIEEHGWGRGRMRFLNDNQAHADQYVKEVVSYVHMLRNPEQYKIRP